MDENPYSRILGLMRVAGSRDNPPIISLATVLTVDPLTIQLYDQTIEKNLYVHPLMTDTIDMSALFHSVTQLAELDPPLVNEAGGLLYSTIGSFAAILQGEIISFLTRFHDLFRLKPDDAVAVQQVDDDFIILSKVVKTG